VRFAWRTKKRAEATYRRALLAVAVRLVQRRWLQRQRRRCGVLAGLARAAAVAAQERRLR
jgi:hypothetical protein